MAKLTADQKRIHEAIEENDITKLKDIFKKLVNGKDAEGKTPLQKTRNEEIMIHLVKNGADVNVQDTDGLTPLHFAAENGQLQVAKLLIESGALVDAKYINGLTPLHRAALHGHTEILKLLIENGATIDAKGGVEKTPLHYKYIAGVAQNYLTLSKITFTLVVVWRPLEEQQLIGGVRLYRWWCCSTHLPRETIHIIQVET